MTALRDEVNISGIYRTHRLQMVRLAVLLVDDRASAEDVVQDAFIGLYRHQRTLRDADTALAYLRRSVINGSRSALRRRRTVRNNPEVPGPTATAGADDAVLLSEEHRAVLEAVQSLPARQREVLVLRYWSNFSEAQIADALGISKGTVKSSASKAADRLSQILGGAR